MSFRQGSKLSAHKKIHRAIQQSSVSQSFVELKLTDLLANQVRTLSTQEVQSQVEVEVVVLPPISGVVQGGPLPLFNLNR